MNISILGTGNMATGLAVLFANAGHTVTFPLWVFGVSRLGIPPEVNVLGTLIFLVAFLFIGVQLWGQRRQGKAAPITLVGR